MEQLCLRMRANAASIGIDAIRWDKLRKAAGEQGESRALEAIHSLAFLISEMADRARNPDLAAHQEETKESDVNLITRHLTRAGQLLGYEVRVPQRDTPHERPPSPTPLTSEDTQWLKEHGLKMPVPDNEKRKP